MRKSGVFVYSRATTARVTPGENDMNASRTVGKLAKWSAAGMGVGVAAYATYAGVRWLQYGHAGPSKDDDDRLLDEFMPTYDIVDRHHTHVEAPAEVTFAAACEIELNASPLVRAIFKGRELLLGSKPDQVDRPRGLVALTESLGWGVLAEIPDREVVIGAVAQPWEANVVFRSVAPDEFVDFHEPGYVKIAWTLRSDPVGDQHSVFRTETRAIATDLDARIRFRRYWSFLSPGIILIRRTMLNSLRVEARRRVREGWSPQTA
jgi:hypothetical protein